MKQKFYHYLEVHSHSENNRGRKTRAFLYFGSNNKISVGHYLLELKEQKSY